MTPTRRAPAATATGRSRARRPLRPRSPPESALRPTPATATPAWRVGSSHHRRNRWDLAARLRRDRAVDHGNAGWLAATLATTAFRAGVAGGLPVEHSTLATAPVPSGRKPRLGAGCGELYGHKLYVAHREAAARLPPGSFLQDRAQHPFAVAIGMQIRDACPSGQLDAWHLPYDQAGLDRVEHELGLDLESLRRERQVRKTRAPERAVAIAEIRERAAIEAVHDAHERAVAGAAQACPVLRAATREVARALHEFRTASERLDEASHFGWVGAAVPVDHHDHLARGGGEARPERQPLSRACLMDDPQVRAQAASDDLGVIGGQPVDQNDLGNPLGDASEHPGQAARLIQRRHHHADRGKPGVLARADGRAPPDRPGLTGSCAVKLIAARPMEGTRPPLRTNSCGGRAKASAIPDRYDVFPPGFTESRPRKPRQKRHP